MNPLLLGILWGLFGFIEDDKLAHYAFTLLDAICGHAHTRTRTHTPLSIHQLCIKIHIAWTLMTGNDSLHHYNANGKQ